jgi:tRNA 2-thiouridine synthesizing protein B
MAMLHTVNKSPFERNALQSCLQHLLTGSSVLLIEDGVYGAMKGTGITEKVQQAMDGVKFYVLGPDLKARGVNDEQVIEGVKVIDYGDFVDLVAEHDNVQSWL